MARRAFCPLSVRRSFIFMAASEITASSTSTQRWIPAWAREFPIEQGCNITGSLPYELNTLGTSLLYYSHFSIYFTRLRDWGIPLTNDNCLSNSDSQDTKLRFMFSFCFPLFISFRLLIAIRTEITDNVEMAPSEVEVEPTVPVNETAYARNEEFFLFATIMDATMIDKKLGDKPVYFEISIGNAGNALDGHNESFKVRRD